MVVIRKSGFMKYVLTGMIIVEKVVVPVLFIIRIEPHHHAVVTTPSRIPENKQNNLSKIIHLSKFTSRCGKGSFPVSGSSAI